MQKATLHRLGLIDYQEAWDYQMDLFQATIQRKLKNRDLPKEEQVPTQNHFIFCQHPHTYTLGKSGDAQHLLANEALLQTIGAKFYHINRGGDITYHGPGQLVGYPIFDLDNFFTDIHKFMRLMEEAIIRFLAKYGLKGERWEGFTGVWLDVDKPSRCRKICAMGVHTSRWVTMHGFALNVSTDLNYFDYIIPCGIENRGVTSLEKELGRSLDWEQIRLEVLKEFEEVFGFEGVEKSEAKTKTSL